MGRSGDVKIRSQLDFSITSELNYTALPRVHTSELRDVTCHAGSHSVTCHPTHVNASHLTLTQKGWY